MPQGLALFECDNCHFINLFGTLCLWCAHSCTPKPSLGFEVRRRASQPHLLNERQKEQLRRMDAPRQGTLAGSMSVPEHLTEAPEERRKRHRDAKVFSVEVMDTDEAVSRCTFASDAEMMLMKYVARTKPPRCMSKHWQTQTLSCLKGPVSYHPSRCTPTQPLDRKITIPTHLHVRFPLLVPYAASNDYQCCDNALPALSVERPCSGPLHANILTTT